MNKSQKDSEFSNRRKNLRKQMMDFGLKNMTTEEVVELMLYYTIPRRDARPIAKELVKRFGTIDRIAKASSAERLRIPGVDEKTDEHFAMIGMFIPYLLRNRLGEYPVLDSIEKIKDFCASIHIMHEYEVLYVLCLNSSNRLIKKESKITVGTPEYINVELKHILDTVANTSTVKVILCHNHPGGSLKPSKNDIVFTQEIFSYLKRIDITLYDHLIVADNSVVSMRELGLIYDK